MGQKKKEEEEEDDFAPITIKIEKQPKPPSPLVTLGDPLKKKGGPEAQPLLSNNSQAKDDEDKRESSV